MRICRYRNANRIAVGIYDDERIVPLNSAAAAYHLATGEIVRLPPSQELIDFLPPDGAGFPAARSIADWLERNPSPGCDVFRHADVDILVPVPRPNKLFLLAGNYAKHIEEGGEASAEREETFDV